MAGDPVPHNGDERNADAPSWPQPGDLRRVPYQPLVIVLLAVGAGMVADRYLPFRAFAQRFDWLAEYNACVVCWLVGATSLTVWFWAWRKQYNRTAGWLVLTSAALAGAAWHHLNWFDFGADIGMNPIPHR